MPLKRKPLRLVSFVGALLLLSNVVWPLPIDQGALFAIAFILFLSDFLGSSIDRSNYNIRKIWQSLRLRSSSWFSSLLTMCGAKARS